MSDGRSRCYDDELEWNDFKRKYKLSETRWDVYSQEATHAKKAVENGMEGKDILLYVKQQMELSALKETHKAEWEALNNFKKLKI